MPLSKADGLVKVLAHDILNSSIRQYEMFALASACQIIAACAQGSFSLPDGKPISLYQMILAPSSAGKGSYIEAIKETVGAVSWKLIGAEPGSREGLRADLHEWNARTIVLDEFQGFLAKLSDDGTPHIKGISDDLKESWPGVKQLQTIKTKTGTTQPVRTPRIGMMGVGTPSGVAKHFGGGVVEDGLLSRFNIFVLDKVTRKRHDRSRFDENKYSDVLHRMFAKGVDFTDPVTNDHWYDSWAKSPTPHNPQMTTPHRLSIEQEALALLRECDSHWEQKLLEDASNPAGSIWDRAARRAEIYAAIHCLGCVRKTITLHDVQFGLMMAETSANNAVALICDHSAQDDDEKDRKKLLRTIKKHEAQRLLTARTLSRYANLYGKRFDVALKSLLQSGEAISLSTEAGVVFQTPPEA